MRTTSAVSFALSIALVAGRPQALSMGGLDSPYAVSSSLATTAPQPAATSADPSVVASYAAYQQQQQQPVGEFLNSRAVITHIPVSATSTQAQRRQRRQTPTSIGSAAVLAPAPAPLDAPVPSPLPVVSMVPIVNDVVQSAVNAVPATTTTAPASSSIDTSSATPTNSSLMSDSPVTTSSTTATDAPMSTASATSTGEYTSWTLWSHL